MNTNSNLEVEPEHIHKKKKLNIYNKCCICLDDIKKPKHAQYLPCCHFFHKICIDKWLEKNTTCPECRIPIFIQDFIQYDSYLKYYTEQKNDLNLVRQNISTNDNAISLRFIQDCELFDIDDIEYNDINKIQALIYSPEPSFEDIYAHLIYSTDESDESDDNIPRVPFNTPVRIIGPNIILRHRYRF